MAPKAVLMTYPSRTLCGYHPEPRRDSSRASSPSAKTVPEGLVDQAPASDDALRQGVERCVQLSAGLVYVQPEVFAGSP